MSRRDRLEVAERVDYAGRGGRARSTRTRRARGRAASSGAASVEAVAVCFINAYANPEHERRMQRSSRRSCPASSISTSTDVLPEIFEHERFSTTVANAVLVAARGGYVRAARSAAGAATATTGDLLLLHSGGGVMTPRAVEELRRAPGRLRHRRRRRSPRATSRALCGFENSIGLDMGGTSTDISLVYDGELRITKEWYVEYGYPICFPSIEVLTIGAGGGSLAWIDAAGSLRNGPQSAGADPGPACYGRGGRSRPTPTPTSSSAGSARAGRRRHAARPRAAAERDPRRRRRAARPRAERGGRRDHRRSPTPTWPTPCGSSPSAAATTRAISRSSRSAAPGRCTAPRWPGSWAIPTVLVPPNPGITSALGLPAGRHPPRPLRDVPAPAAEADPGESRRVRARSSRGARAARPRGRGRGRRDARSARSTCATSASGARSRSVSPRRRSRGSSTRFHAEHEREYNLPPRRHAGRALPAQGVAVGVDAEGRARRATSPGRAARAASRRRAGLLRRATAPSTRRLRARGPAAGSRFEGPAVIDQLDSTTLVPPGRDGGGRRVAEHPPGGGGVT